MPTHESEQRHRLSPPAARAAPPALPRPFPQPDPSPQSPSSGHLPVSSSCLQGSRSTLCPKTGYRTETDRSKSWPRPPRCEMRNGRAMSVSFETILTYGLVKGTAHPEFNTDPKLSPSAVPL